MRALLAVVASAFVLTGGAAGAIAAEPEVEIGTQRDGAAIRIEASAVLDADVEAAWRVLTDYERYAQFIPDMQSSRVVSRKGNAVVLEQRGDARFLWMRQPVVVRLAVTETPPHVVESRLLGGTLIDMEGRYELSDGEGGTRLRYRGRIVPDDGTRGLLDQLVVRQNVQRQFTALVREIARVNGR